MAKESNLGTIKTEKLIQQKENNRQLGQLQNQRSCCINFLRKIKKDYFNSL